jgi:hypothetical protein
VDRSIFAGTTISAAAGLPRSARTYRRQPICFLIQFLDYIEGNINFPKVFLYLYLFNVETAASMPLTKEKILSPSRAARKYAEGFPQRRLRISVHSRSAWKSGPFRPRSGQKRFNAALKRRSSTTLASLPGREPETDARSVRWKVTRTKLGSSQEQTASCTLLL